MTQEHLAEKLDVSRQTISKWESDACYPEIDKLLQLCSIFGCTSDEILCGDLDQGTSEFETEPETYAADSTLISEDIHEKTAERTLPKHLPEKEEYDLYIKKFALSMAFGVFIVLLSVSALLFLQSRGVNDGISVAVMLLLIAIATVIFIIKGIDYDRFKSEFTEIPDFYSQEERKKASKALAYFISAGLIMVLFGIIFLIVTDETGHNVSESSEMLHTSVFMLCIGIASFLFVFSGIYHDRLETTEQKRKKAESEKNKRNFSGAIMLTATAVYLVLGFCFNLWHPGWLVFPVGGILCGIIECITGSNKEE